MRIISALRKLCLEDSPSGREDMLFPQVESLFNEFGSLKISNLNNIYIHKKGKDKNRIMLMAHSDEVFLMVTEVLNNGFLKFKSKGIDVKELPSQEVNIHGKEVVPGIIGIKPPHLMESSDASRAVEADKLYIDTGLSKERITNLIHEGDYVTLKRNFHELLNGNVTCKAMDDRAGIAALYKCAKDLAEKDLNSDVYYVCSSQEELGHRGAKSACSEINPCLAVAIDTTFDSGKMGASDRDNHLGKGPVICVGPNIHPKLKDFIIEIAKTENIPYQIEVEPGNTGTDAWDIQIAGEGVPVLLISIPVKYMHTTVEVVNMEDIKHTGKLLSSFIERLDELDLEGLLCY